MFLWDVIESNKMDRHRDQLALTMLLRGVPPKVHSLLIAKKSMTEAWEMIREMRLGAEHVMEVNAQRLLGKFKHISLKQGEMINEFAIRISKLTTDLCGLTENNIDDT